MYRRCQERAAADCQDAQLYKRVLDKVERDFKRWGVDQIYATVSDFVKEAERIGAEIRAEDVDLARSILPPGQSELPDSPTRLVNVELWTAGKLHPAPLSRDAVQRIVESRLTLSP